MSRMSKELTDLKPDLHLYKLNEAGTTEYIKGKLVVMGIPFQTYKGNIFGVQYPDRPLFVAHMDTVGEETVQEKLKVSRGFLQRKRGFVLGADDKAGIDILLNNIQDINFCFTVGEETGCTGAKDLGGYVSFLEAIDELPCAIEYDRNGEKDLIVYCGKDLIKEVEKLTHYEETDGLFTDITQWEDIIPGVNLSCGYHNAHSRSEYLDLSEWQKAARTLPSLNMIRGKYKLSGKKPYSYKNEWSGYKFNTSYPYAWNSEFKTGHDYMDDPNPWSEGEPKVCDICGQKGDLTDDFYEVNGYDRICAYCLASLYDIRRI